MERSAIRGRHRRGTEVPDYAPLHPGYRMSYNTHPPAGGLAITPRTNRILTAVIFAVLWTDYATLVGIVRQAVSDLPAGEQRQILYETAAKLYGL